MSTSLRPRHAAFALVIAAGCAACEAPAPASGLSAYPQASAQPNSSAAPAPATPPRTPVALKVLRDGREVGVYPPDTFQTQQAAEERGKRRRNGGIPLGDFLRSIGQADATEAHVRSAEGQSIRIADPNDPRWVLSVNRRGLTRLSRLEGTAEAAENAGQGGRKGRKAWLTNLAELELRSATAAAR